jgi:hypothetical protein
VLLVFGMTVSHLPADWDVAVVTSRKAERVAGRMFGVRTKVVRLEPPILGLEVGRRRMVDPFDGVLHASEAAAGVPGARMMRLWGAAPGGPWDAFGERRGEPEPFSLLEFNSLVRGGAVGFYPGGMDDGYDVQARRHLALGGEVSCRRDPEVLGDLADLCYEFGGRPAGVKAPEGCIGDPPGWAEAVRGIIGGG